MRPGVLPPGLGEMVADLHRRLRALESAPVSGQGVSTFSGTVAVRPTQVGFACELTSSWSSSTGYSWKRLVLADVTVGTPDIQLTGDHAATVDNNTSLTSGVRGWLEPDQNAGGWIFTARSPSAPVSPTPPTYGVVPALDTGGNLILTSLTVDNSGTDSVTQYVVPDPGDDPASVPVIQNVVENDGAASITQSVFVDGTGGGTGYQAVMTPTSYTLTYDYGGTTAGYTVAPSGGDTRIAFTGAIDFTGATVTGLAASGVTRVTVPVDFSDLAVAAGSTDIEVYSLPAGGIILGVILRVVTGFDSGEFVSYNMSVGVSGTAQKYISTASVLEGPSLDTYFYANNGTGISSRPAPENFGSATSIRLFASALANLDTATVGEVEVILLVSNP